MSEPRAALLDSVKTPIAFLALVLLVVEITVGSLAVPLVEYRTPLVWTIIISVFSFALIVVGLAIFLPEALSGGRPLQEVHARKFASDLFLALDGALSNLENTERAEAWLTVADVVKSDSKPNDTFGVFCLTVADRLTQLANLSNRTLSTRGPIKP